MVARTEDGGHDHGVDEGAGDVGADHLEDEREGRGGGVFVGEVGGRVGDVKADEEDGDDVEEEDTPEDVLDYAGDVLVRIGGLTGCDGDGFSAAIWWGLVDRSEVGELGETYMRKML